MLQKFRKAIFALPFVFGTMAHAEQGYSDSFNRFKNIPFPDMAVDYAETMRSCEALKAELFKRSGEFLQNSEELDREWEELNAMTGITDLQREALEDMLNAIEADNISLGHTLLDYTSFLNRVGDYLEENGLEAGECRIFGPGEST